MFKNEFPERDKFDEMILNMESAFIELSSAQSEFILLMFREFATVEIELNIGIALYMFEKPVVVNISKIYFDDDSESIKLSADSMNDDLSWDELDVTAHEIIINNIHSIYSAEKIKNKFKDEDNYTSH